jgi:SAM-dependent methyltransferase
VSETELRRAVAAFAAGLPTGGAVLDVGCGARPYENLFPDSSYTGIDVEHSGRSADYKRPDVYFDGLSIPYDEASFDSVICTQVLEHSVDPDALLREMCRVLRPGGRLLITVPFMWGLHEVPFDFRRYSMFGLPRVVEAAGLRVLHIDQLSRGIDAIEMLVASEQNNFRQNVMPKRAMRRAPFTWVLEGLEPRLWRLQVAVWRRLYRFERLYIDNLLVAERPS